jgi:hypothetical protein
MHKNFKNSEKCRIDSSFIASEFTRIFCHKKMHKKSIIAHLIPRFRKVQLIQKYSINAEQFNECRKSLKSVEKFKKCFGKMRVRIGRANFLLHKKFFSGHNFCNVSFFLMI